MKRGFCLAFLVAVSVCFAVQQSFAVSVALTNPSFEDPAGVKTVGDATWSNIPGWTSSGPSVDSGTEPFTPLPQPDLGVNIAFLQSGDGSIFQTTARSLAAGDIYTLTFYERDDYQATELTASLYYDDGGTRVPFARRGADQDQRHRQGGARTYVRRPLPGRARQRGSDLALVLR